MQTEFGFYPDAARGRRVDAAVRTRLAESLENLASIVAGALRPGPGQLLSLAQAVRAHPVLPGVMVLYADLVPLLLAGEPERSGQILDLLDLPVWQSFPVPRVVTLDDRLLGPGMADRYASQWQDDPLIRPGFVAVPAQGLEQAQIDVAAARQMLNAAAPALDAEIDALMSEIVVVDTNSADGNLVFHGASSFFVWGALALNLAEHGTRVKLIEGIVHEAAHGLLHGLTLGNPLVVNDPALRYASPLRDDLRPMDGLVHAAYVVARMHFAMAATEQAADATAVERDEARDRKASAAGAFKDALTTIAEHARFTSDGAAIFAGAVEYMTHAHA